MGERMLDKAHQPTEDEIRQFVGAEAGANLQIVRTKLADVFDLNVELKFPFGNEYGWGYKFSHKTRHLFYLFFERGGLVLMTQIREPSTDRERSLLADLSSAGKKCWESKYPCASGGWIHYRIDSAKAMRDAAIFISLRTGKTIDLA